MNKKYKISGFEKLDGKHIIAFGDVGIDDARGHWLIQKAARIAGHHMLIVSGPADTVTSLSSIRGVIDTAVKRYLILIDYKLLVQVRDITDIRGKLITADDGKLLIHVSLARNGPTPRVLESQLSFMKYIGELLDSLQKGPFLKNLRPGWSESGPYK